MLFYFQSAVERSPVSKSISPSQPLFIFFWTIPECCQIYILRPLSLQKTVIATTGCRPPEGRHIWLVIHFYFQSLIGYTTSAKTNSIDSHFFYFFSKNSKHPVKKNLTTLKLPQSASSRTFVFSVSCGAISLFQARFRKHDCFSIFSKDSRQLSDIHYSDPSADRRRPSPRRGTSTVYQAHGFFFTLRLSIFSHKSGTLPCPKPI